MVLTDAQVLHFRTFGFIVLRQVLTPKETTRYFRELQRALRTSWGSASPINRNHWVPALSRFSPFAMSLIDQPRFAGAAEQLLGRPVLGEMTDAVVYTRDTPWHHDAVNIDLAEAVKFTLYRDSLRAGDGALRFIPGSHRPPLQTELSGETERYGVMPADLPSYVFECEPGDAVAFDVRVWHAAFGGKRRVAGSVNFRIDPCTDDEIAAARKYWELNHRRFGTLYDGDLYPADWRAVTDARHQRWVQRLAELDLLDARRHS